MIDAMNAALAAAPFATQENVSAQFAAHSQQVQGQLAAMQAQLQQMQAQMQAQLALLQVNLIAQMQVMLMPQNAPAIVIAVATARAVLAARARNAHDLRGVAYAAVPRDDGSLPPNWPAAFSRDALVEGPIGVIDAILNDWPAARPTPWAFRAPQRARGAHRNGAGVHETKECTLF